MSSSLRPAVAGLITVVLALGLALAGLRPAPAAAAAAEPVWTQTTITTPDGITLLTDVLHPADMPAEEGPRPVLLIVSPYLGDEGGTDWSKRFTDFFGCSAPRKGANDSSIGRAIATPAPFKNLLRLYPVFISLIESFTNTDIHIARSKYNLLLKA